MDQQSCIVPLIKDDVMIAAKPDIDGLMYDCSNSMQCVSTGVTAVLHLAIDISYTYPPAKRVNEIT